MITHLVGRLFTRSQNRPHQDLNLCNRRLAQTNSQDQIQSPARMTGAVSNVENSHSAAPPRTTIRPTPNTTARKQWFAARCRPSDSRHGRRSGNPWGTAPGCPGWALRVEPTSSPSQACGGRCHKVLNYLSTLSSRTLEGVFGRWSHQHASSQSSRGRSRPGRLRYLSGLLVALAPEASQALSPNGSRRSSSSR